MEKKTQVFLHKAQDFINSIPFVYAVALAVLAIWWLGWELAGFALLVIFASTTLLLQRNVTPFVAITGLVTFCVSLKQLPHDLKNGVLPDGFVWFILYLAVLFAYMVFCVAFHKKKYPRQNKKFLNLNGSFVTIIIALALGGLFSEYFSVVNNALVVLLYAVLFVIYLVLSSGDVPNFKQLVAHLTFAVGLVVCGEMLIKMLNSTNLVQDLITKNMSLGWGGSNNIGTTVCFAVMMALYLFATTDNPLYMVFAAIFSIFVALTMSRGNIWSLVVALPFAVGYAVYKCKHKLRAGITLVAIFGVIAVFALCNQQLLLDLFSGMLDKGLDDNGRRELWGQFAHLFTQNPIFGVGYYDPISGIMWTPHAILIHIMSGMGFFGLIAFGYHYYRKYIMLLSHSSTFRFFTVAVCYQLFMYSVVDMDFYMIYQNFLVFGAIEALKQEREELGITHQILRVPLWTNVCLFVAGLALAVVAAIYMANSIYIEGIYYMLDEKNYIITFALYAVSAVLVFISWGNLWRNYIKPKVMPKVKTLLKQDAKQN